MNFSFNKNYKFLHQIENICWFFYTCPIFNLLFYYFCTISFIHQQVHLKHVRSSNIEHFVSIVCFFNFQRFFQYLNLYFQKEIQRNERLLLLFIFKIFWVFYNIFLQNQVFVKQHTKEQVLQNCQESDAMLHYLSYNK